MSGQKAFFRVSSRLPFRVSGFAFTAKPESSCSFYFLVNEFGVIGLGAITYGRLALETRWLPNSKNMNQQEKVHEVRLQDESERIIVQSLAKLDGTALGVALGVLGGLSIFGATAFLLYKGGDVIGPNLSLLAQFFPGYEVSITGSFIGAFYGLISGFIVGWMIALLRNFAVSVYIHFLKLKSSMSAVGDYIDNP